MIFILKLSIFEWLTRVTIIFDKKIKDFIFLRKIRILLVVKYNKFLLKVGIFLSYLSVNRWLVIRYLLIHCCSCLMQFFMRYLIKGYTDLDKNVVILFERCYFFLRFIWKMLLLGDMQNVQRSVLQYKSMHT